MPGFLQLFRSRAPSYQPIEDEDEDIGSRSTQKSFPSWRYRGFLALGITILIISMLTFGTTFNRYYNELNHSRLSSSVIIPSNDSGIRKEWRSLSPNEKHRYISAVQCLSTKPSKLTENTTLYDDFGYVHTLVGMNIHDSALFLPWHRYFLHIYEKSLRQECGYEGGMVYWDWAQDWEDPTNAAVWDSHTGFGGDGRGEPVTIDGIFLGYCVIDGPFSGLVPQYFRSYLRPHCLTRAFSNGKTSGGKAESGYLDGTKYRPSVMKYLSQATDYDQFRGSMEDVPHLAIPLGINGDMGSFSAPNDPIFFLHHTQIDRLWWLWQQSDLAARQEQYNGPSKKDSEVEASLNDVIRMLGLAVDVTVSEVMRTENDLLRYQY